MSALDPTAQTEPLTTDDFLRKSRPIGQQLVAAYETNLFSEPCDLAAAIDAALARHRRFVAWTLGASASEPAGSIQRDDIEAKLIELRLATAPKDRHSDLFGRQRLVLDADGDRQCK